MSSAGATRTGAGAEPGVRTAPGPLGDTRPRSGRLELLTPPLFDLAAALAAHGGTDPPLSARSAAGDTTGDATYFDSADLALAAQDTTLVRYPDGRWAVETCDGDAFVTGGFAGAGYAWDGAGRPDDVRWVPPAIRDRLHTRLRSRRLAAVARIVTARSTIEVFSGSAAVARVVHDDLTVHAADGIRRYGRLAVVATVPGRRGRDALRVLADACAAAGCTPAPRANALQLACRVLSPPGTVVAPAMPERPRSAGLADLVAPMLGASVQRLFAHDNGVRLDTDPEDVHQLRVATRRLRADLRALRPALDRPRAAQLRAEASWLASLAGPVRDADVLLARMNTTIPELPGAADDDGARLLLRLATQRQAHLDALLTGMRSARYDALLDALAEAVAHPPVRQPARGRAGRRASVVLRRATAEQWHELVEAVQRVGPAARAAELHRVRIAAKHARYTAEAAAAALGKHATRLAALATRAQTLLGDLHDAMVAQVWLRDAADDPALAGIAERLLVVEQARSAALQAQWLPLWAEIAPKGRRELKALSRR